MKLSSLKGKTTFSNISNIITSIHTSNSGIIYRDIKRIGKILITKPLIHNKSISTERQRIDRQIINAGRDTKIISNRTNIPATNRSGNLRDRILNRRNPSRLSIFTHQLFPMLPHNTIRHKKEISVNIQIIHHGSKQRLHTGHHRGLKLESISGQNLIHIKRNNITNIIRQLHRMITPKCRTRQIQIGRIKSKAGIFITRHQTNLQSANCCSREGAYAPSVDEGDGLFTPAGVGGGCAGSEAGGVGTA